jgi:hypothetical protein
MNKAVSTSLPLIHGDLGKIVLPGGCIHVVIYIFCCSDFGDDLHKPSNRLLKIHMRLVR